MALCILLVVVTQILLSSVLGIDKCPLERTNQLNDEARLHHDLLCAYDADFRPVAHHKTPVQVNIQLSVRYFNFDALEETFHVHSYVFLGWKDELLKWTPGDYGDIKEIYVESQKIWTPKMVLYNADATWDQHYSIDSSCSVTFEGEVFCVPHRIYTGMCSSTLRLWPYDTQNCTLYFGNSVLPGEHVNFTFYEKRIAPIEFDDYQQGPGWKLLSVEKKRLPGTYTCCPKDTYPMLQYTFLLKREAAGIAAIVVVPSVVNVILTLASLLLNTTNIRLMLASFSLFGHFLFLIQIGATVPKHSSDTPLILLFVRDSMILTTGAVLETLLLMVFTKRTTPAPGWVISLTRLVTSGPGKYVVFTNFEPEELENKSFTDDETPNNNFHITSEWIQFANLLNSFVFFFTFLVYLILVFAYIPYVS